MATNYGRNKAPNPKHGPGGAAGDTSLSSAVEELHKQHPYKYTETMRGRPASNCMINKRPFNPGPGY